MSSRYPSRDESPNLADRCRDGARVLPEEIQRLPPEAL